MFHRFGTHLRRHRRVIISGDLRRHHVIRPAVINDDLAAAIGETREVRTVRVENVTKFLFCQSRIAVEIGADAIKTDWSGTIEGFRHVVQGAADAPVLVAGGPRLDDDRATLGLVRDLLAAGARGVMFGRSLFQSPEPLVLMKAVRDMVHDDVSYEDAVARLSPAPAKAPKVQLSRARPKSRPK